MDRFDESIDDRDLQAYVDGRLDRDPRRKAQVEAYLEHRPEAREHVRLDRAVADRIRERYGEIPDDPPPPRLLRTLMRGSPGGSGTRPRTKALAAAMILIAALSGWSVGRFGATAESPKPNLAEGLERHRGAADTPSPAAATTRPATMSSKQGASQQRTGKTDMLTMQAPDLSPLGYALEGTESSEGRTRYRTNLFYRDREGDLITVVLERPKQPADTAPTVERLDDVQSAYWQDGSLTVLVIGDRIEANLPTIKSAVDRAFQKIEKGALPAYYSGEPLVAEDLTHGQAPSALSPGEAPMPDRQIQ
ncbi:hypothetical protein KAJ83_14590 [Marivibrio halodurans]|uniref:Transmembrane transcriptional regulator (Anti-sigma factor RsiW) n=1 Tax=Marivibrio halodurans TaxID=2039722 RepID=A0A8J7S0Z3_9PROT|nr:hypothetical protein [Marivibrio halodurans]MBP5858245.1 hypothetical protein [Marivibrio halodurans]